MYANSMTEHDDSLIIQLCLGKLFTSRVLTIKSEHLIQLTSITSHFFEENFHAYKLEQFHSCS